MTAFSRTETKGDWGSLSWEIRSVNHRYLEITPRLPDSLRDLEPLVRDKLRLALSRGKVEVALKLKTEVTTNRELKLNLAYLQQLLAVAEQIQSHSQDHSPLPTIELLKLPGLLEAQEADLGLIQETAMNALDQTIQDFIAHREREGEATRLIILDRLDRIMEQVETCRIKIPQILQQQRNRILQRLDELKVSLDQDRLEQELAYLAQKSDVDEELDRLSTHVTEVRRSLQGGGACGRRLDFLMQELNREANTLGSKSLSTETTQVSVELKVLIEQMREQIQNIE
jgi:uncharacterized protein (TIGR00255 family)